MRAIVYRATGGPDVLSLETRDVPTPAAGEVLVEIRVSGVNPTDWKSRAGATATGQAAARVPNQDGGGVITAVGPGVPAGRVGERVWIWEAAWQRADGTAQDYVALPSAQAVALPDALSDDIAFDVGASLGIPALTAHRALTLAGPSRLEPGALGGRTVLVAGGAGAVGHAAIELGRWAGATVITTVSGPEKAELASAAGAHHVVNYRDEDAAAAIRRIAPDGVHLVVEVSPAANAELDLAVAAPGATVAFYANNGGDEIALPVRPSMAANLSWRGILIYTIGAEAKAAAVADVSAALAHGALRVGADAGLPLHRFPLERTAQAHQAVEQGAVGKVLIDVVHRG